jgi:predicted DNA-binding transcriptional regulator AlpA
MLRFYELNDTRGIIHARRHLYALKSEITFSKGVPLGENPVGWLESEIGGWIPPPFVPREVILHCDNCSSCNPECLVDASSVNLERRPLRFHSTVASA